MEVKGNNRNISRLLIYKWHNWFPDCAFDLGDATRSGGRLLCKYNTKSPVIWTRHFTVREVMSNYDVIKFLVLNILTDDSEWYSRVFDSWLMRCEKPAGDQVKRYRICMITTLQKCQSGLMYKMTHSRCSFYTQSIYAGNALKLLCIALIFVYLHYDCIYQKIISYNCQSCYYKEKNSKFPQTFWRTLVLTSV